MKTWRLLALLCGSRLTSAASEALKRAQTFLDVPGKVARAHVEERRRAVEIIDRQLVFVGSDADDRLLLGAVVFNLKTVRARIAGEGR